ncbi:MAG: hypothetical protein AAF384_11205 [Pseudomonadota bacterium]
MTNLPTPTDRQRLVMERFKRRLLEDLRPLITEDLIAEHHAQPLGQHSDALERVLNFLRSPPYYGLYAKRSCREYQIIHLPVDAEAGPQVVSDQIYTDKDEAMHEVFLLNLAKVFGRRAS